MGNCTFWYSSDISKKFQDGGSGGSGVLYNNGGAASYIQYVSQNITNYNGGAYGGTGWTELSGKAQSNPELGVPGYGKLEKAEGLWEPFDTVKQ